MDAVELRIRANDLDRPGPPPVVEVYRRDGRTWIVVVGDLSAGDVAAVGDVIDGLSAEPGMTRVSVDLTCATARGRRAAELVSSLRAAAGAWLDIATAGPVSRLGAHWHVAA